MSDILTAKSVRLRDAEGRVIAPRTRASIVEIKDGSSLEDVIVSLLEKIDQLETKVAELEADEANLLELNVPEEE